MTESESLRSWLSDRLDRLSDKIDGLASNVASQSAEHAGLAHRVASLEESLETIQKLRVRAALVEREVEGLKTQNETLRGEVAELRKPRRKRSSALAVGVGSAGAGASLAAFYDQIAALFHRIFGGGS